MIHFVFTGLGRTSHISQLAAFDGDDTFNQYIVPGARISEKASTITGLTFDFCDNQMYHHGNPVESKDIKLVLLEFIDFIRKKEKPILFGHNIAAFDIPILLHHLKQHSLLSEFLLHIIGCIDTLKLAKRKFKKTEFGNHKQQTLVKELVGSEYDAHDACADVSSLFLLLDHLEYSEKDIFPFNATLLADSFNPLTRSAIISKPMARKLANCGLCLKHLKLAFERGSESGLKSVLSEHGLSVKTVNTISKYFHRTEE